MSAHNHFGVFQERKEAAADELKRAALATLASQNWFGTAMLFGVEKAFQPIRLAQRTAATDSDFTERLHTALPIVVAELRAAIPATEPFEVTSHYLLKHILSTMDMLNTEATPGRGVPSSILLDIVGQLHLTSEFRRGLRLDQNRSSEPSPSKVDIPLQAYLASHRNKNDQAGPSCPGSPTSSASTMEPEQVLKVVAKGGPMWGDCITRAVQEKAIVGLVDWCEVMFNGSLLGAVCDSGLCPRLASTITHARGSMEEDHLVKLEGLLLKLYQRSPDPLRRSLRQEIVMGYGAYSDPDRALGGVCDRVLMEAFNQFTAGSEFSLDGVLAAIASPGSFVDRFFAFALTSKDLSSHLTDCAVAVAPVLKVPDLVGKAVIREFEAKGSPSRLDALAGLLQSLLARDVIDTGELIENVILPHLESKPECVLDPMAGQVCMRVLQWAVDMGQLSVDVALRVLAALKGVIGHRDDFPVGKVEMALELCRGIVSKSLQSKADERQTSIASKVLIEELIGSERHMALLLLPALSTGALLGFDLTNAIRVTTLAHGRSFPVVCESEILEVSRCGEEGQKKALEMYRNVVDDVDGFENMKGRLLGALVCVLPQCTRVEFQQITQSFLPSALETILPKSSISTDRTTEYSIELVMRVLSFYVSAPNSTADILARVKGPTSVADIQSLVRNTVGFVKDMLPVLEMENKANVGWDVLQMVCECIHASYSTDTSVSEQLCILILDIMKSAGFEKVLRSSEDTGVCVDCVSESLQKLRPEHSQAALDRLNDLTHGPLAR